MSTDKSIFVADVNSFGTKMLQKMGWEKGKGLGANLDGNQDFIKVNHKSNQKGFGFQDRDDQWTQHEDNFNSLLSSFKTHSADNADDDEATPKVGFGFTVPSTVPQAVHAVTKADVFSGVSLEEQSKKSRSRVHYKKFTRGKDLARYSEKDLANIFGKKTLSDKHTSEPEIENGTGEDLNFGVAVIQTGTSVNDYFRAKMGAKMAAQRGPTDNKNPFYIHKQSKVDESIAQEDQNSDNKRTKSKKDASISSSLEVDPSEDTGFEKEKKQKSKKKKKSRNELNELTIDDEEASSIKKKSKKKTKSKNEQLIDNSDTNIDFVEAKIQTLTNPEDEIFEIPLLSNETEISKKKKKKRKLVVDSVEESTEMDLPELKKSKKDKKKKKKASTIVDEVNHKALHFPILLSTVLNSLYTQDVTITKPDTVTSASPATTSPMAAPTTSSVDVFELAKYKAEVFRFFDFGGFCGASLCDIPGYGYSRNLQLRVVQGFRDDMRISNFWDQALVNKYGEDVIQIKKVRKHKKYNINVLKKKNVFKFWKDWKTLLVKSCWAMLILIKFHCKA